MGLDLSLNNALSGLQASQQALAVLSQNIANANTPGYSRQQVAQSAVNVGSQGGDGVVVTGITRDVDQYISKSAVTLSSSVASTNTINSFYSQMQTYIGQPGDNNSIDSYTSTFFNSLSTLAASPTDSSLKITAVSSATTLATQISGLASNLENLRYSADTQISQATTEVNTALKTIYNLNSAIISASQNNSSTNGLEDNLTAALTTVAGDVDINYTTNANGTVNVSTSSGQPLVSGSTLYQLNYTPVANVSQLSDGTKLNPIYLQAVDSSGKPIGTPSQLATGGTSSSVSTSLTGGKIAGLLNVRDSVIPDSLTQLDNLASNLQNSVNAIQNAGTSYPPPQTLTGQSLVGAQSSTSWSGSVVIAALNADGTPVTSPYASDTTNGVGMTPLTINLSTLNSGAGAGKPTVQSIINQINQYYGAPNAHAKLGDLNNIQLVSNSDSLTAGSGTYNFSLSLSNISGNSDGVVVTGATIKDAANNPVTITSPAAFPTASVTSAGDNTAASIPFSANMSTAGAGPYTVSMNVQTTAADGTVSNGTVTYTLNNTSAGMLNDTFPATAATGSATLELPTNTQPIMTAKLVDANGNELPKDPTTGDYIGSGYLVISGATSSTRVAIDQLNSSDTGNTQTKTAATGEGFSQFYGLNNFFNDDGSSGTTNAALNLSVRSDIASNPQTLSLGYLSQSTSSNVTGAQPKYTYEIGSGSTGAITDLSSLATKSINFAAAGSAPASGATLGAYAGQIIAINSSQASTATDNFNEATLVQQGFSDQNNSISGVNIDEEMANTIVYQNAYSANARVISVTSDLFQSLLGAFTGS